MNEDDYENMLATLSWRRFRIIQVIDNIVTSKEQNAILSKCIYNVFTFRGTIKRLIGELVKSNIMQRKDGEWNTTFRGLIQSYINL